MSSPTATQPSPAQRLSGHRRIFVVGLGGVGSIVLRYLAIFLKSMRLPIRLCLLDGDEYQHANQDRQIFDAIGNKAEVQAAETLRILGTSQVSVAAIPEYLTPENVGQFIRSGDILFACVDSHGVRRLISDYCVSDAVSDICLLSGGNDPVDPPRQRGTYGNAQIYLKQAGTEATVPITAFHPELANAEIEDREPGCGELVASQPQILFANLMVASSLLNAFYAYLCGELRYQEVKFDIIEARMLPQLEFTMPR